MAKDANKRLEPALGPPAAEPRLDAEPPRALPYESVADLLRATREQYGEDLKSVAEALRIRLVHLQAIEDGRFRDLPGTAYAIGFVRSYAEYMGLDGAEVVERFKEEVEGIGRKTQLVFPTPVPEGSIPGGAIILVSLLLIGVAYGAWVYFSDEGTQVADLIPPVPEHLQTLVQGEDTRVSQNGAENGADGQAGQTSTPPTGEPTGAGPSAAVQPVEEAPADPAAPSQPTEVAEQAATGDAGDSPAASTASQASGESEASTAAAGPTPALAAANEAQASAAEGAQPAEASGPDPAPATTEERDGIPEAPQLATGVPGRETQVYGADNEDARIVLRAVLDSWVQVRDGDDSLLMTRVLREGDSYRVPNRGGLTLLTGNAGGLEILVDGKKLPPIGPVGAVRRNIALNPESLAKDAAAAQ